MHSFDTTKKQVLDRTDIIALVSEHVALKRRGRSWVGLCPFHNEKTPSFTVSPERGTFKCFGCGKGGDVFTFVQTRENISFVEALQLLADRAGVEVRRGTETDRSEPGRGDLAKVNAWAARFFRANLLDENLGAGVRQYLLSRGISDEASERFDLGFAPGTGSQLVATSKRSGFGVDMLLAADLVRQGDDGGAPYDTFRNRLMFPIRDATRRVVGFGGRTLGDDRAKYLNTRQTVLFDKGRGLYGIDLAREAISDNGRSVLVEGYTDCIAAHQAGFFETVATLGTALTESQVDLLRRYGDELVVLFDSDAAGEEAADRAIRVALPRCMAVRMARIPGDKDPCDFLANDTPEAFSDVLNRAVDALEFKWLRSLERVTGQGSESRKHEAVLEFLRVIAGALEAGAVDEIQRGLLVNQVAHVLQMDGREVHRLLGRLANRQSTPKTAQAVGGSTGEPDRPQGEIHRAWVTLLEVAFAEPGAMTGIEALPQPAPVLTQVDRRLAAIVLNLVERFSVFKFSDVLASCNEPGDVERATELARRGAERGNYKETLALAVARIRRATAEWEANVNREASHNPGKSSEHDESARSRLEAVQGSAQNRRHFAPRRFLSFTGQAPAPSVSTEDDVASVEHP